MRQDATSDEVMLVVNRLTTLGADVQVTTDAGQTLVSGSAESLLAEQNSWSDFSGVERVVPAIPGGRKVGREFKSLDTVVRVGEIEIGDGSVTVVAGPCAVETRDQLLTTALAVKASGAQILRGDAFKPRTSTYSFRGLGKPALELLAEAREVSGLPFVAEVLDPRDVEMVASYADMVRIGTRNMSNHALLREVGNQSKPVQLKRGRAATVDEWIDAAEYVSAAGNGQIVMVERGIRGFDPVARNTLDLTAVAIVKMQTHLPVMVDPSHASGRSDLVAPLARAAVAAGADGLMLDVHPDPSAALVDGAQALSPNEFAQLMSEVAAIAAALQRPA